MKSELFSSHLCFAIPNRLTIDLNLSSSHQMTGLFGPSGSGKTTILKLISGWLKSDSFVCVNQKRIDNSPGSSTIPLRHRGISMVFQDDLLFPHLSVRQNAEFAMRHAPAERKIDPAIFDSLVHEFGIGKLLNSSIKNLSGGERQRVGLVRALAARPQLLLCDEPVSALDRKTRMDLLNHLRNWVDHEQIVMIMVTHDLDELRQFTGHVWHIDSGQLVAEGNPNNLFPANGVKK